MQKLKEIRPSDRLSLLIMLQNNTCAQNWNFDCPSFSISNYSIVLPFFSLVGFGRQDGSIIASKILKIIKKAAKPIFLQKETFFFFFRKTRQNGAQFMTRQGIQNRLKMRFSRPILYLPNK